MSTVTTPIESAVPPVPQTLEATGLRLDMIMQLLLKTLHATGELHGTELADRLGVPFSVIDPAIEAMKTQRFCEIVGGSPIGPPSYKYRISDLGRERAVNALATSLYAGEAPVPLRQYQAYMAAFAEERSHRVSPEMIRDAFSHLVLSDSILNQLGPAINANHSLFVYGPPGNGKTVIAQAIGKVMSGDIWLPHALEVDGAIIKMFDPINHEPLEQPSGGVGLDTTGRYDKRWIRCRRPTVTVGGELMLEALDLSYSEVAGFYRAPMQLLANGGVLLIDDFGRQRCSPQELLNRWIHPLESRTDYLTLQSGQKIDVPFMVLPIFATNIKPADLVDEAFLRRIRYKVCAESPSAADFSLIFKNMCREMDLEFDPALVSHLLDNILAPKNIPLRGCQPRDLINMSMSLARYLDQPRRLTIPLLESTCETYFVDEQQGLDLRN